MSDLTKKLILPTKIRPFSEVTVCPSLDSLLSDALAILASELAFYRAKTKRGAILTQQESKILRDYIESLVKVSREARELSRAEDLSNLSNEDLVDLATKLINSKNKQKTISTNEENSGN